MSVSASSPEAPKRPWALIWRCAFGLGVLCLMGWAASEINWPEVAAAFQRMPARTLLLAACFGAASYACYASYDLLGRAWAGHHIPKHQVMLTSFVCYAFAMNLGSLVGGLALRFRLYRHFGLQSGQIGKVFGLALVTNWLGYAALAGGVCWFHALRWPPDWPLPDKALPWLGCTLWLLAASYLGVCAFAKHRQFHFRRAAFTLPSGRLALTQLLVSSLNWLSSACMIWLLLPDGMPYSHVLAALLVAAVAGVVTHIPAGLGVLEGVFVALLTPACPAPTLLAALLAYRALYYLLPLSAAAAVYFFLESRR